MQYGLKKTQNLMLISNPLKKLQNLMRKRLSTKTDRKMDIYYCVQKLSACRPAPFWCFFAFFTTNSNFEQLYSMYTRSHFPCPSILWKELVEESTDLSLRGGGVLTGGITSWKVGQAVSNTASLFSFCSVYSNYREIHCKKRLDVFPSPIRM